MTDIFSKPDYAANQAAQLAKPIWGGMPGLNMSTISQDTASKAFADAALQAKLNQTPETQRQAILNSWLQGNPVTSQPTPTPPQQQTTSVPTPSVSQQSDTAQLQAANAKIAAFREGNIPATMTYKYDIYGNVVDKYFVAPGYGLAGLTIIDKGGGSFDAMTQDMAAKLFAANKQLQASGSQQTIMPATGSLTPGGAGGVVVTNEKPTTFADKVTAQGVTIKAPEPVKSFVSNIDTVSQLVAQGKPIPTPAQYVSIESLGVQVKLVPITGQAEAVDPSALSAAQAKVESYKRGNIPASIVPKYDLKGNVIDPLFVRAGYGATGITIESPAGATPGSYDLMTPETASYVFGLNQKLPEGWQVTPAAGSMTPGGAGSISVKKPDGTYFITNLDAAVREFAEKGTISKPVVVTYDIPAPIGWSNYLEKQGIEWKPVSRISNEAPNNFSFLGDDWVKFKLDGKDVTINTEHASKYLTILDKINKGDSIYKSVSQPMGTTGTVVLTKEDGTNTIKPIGAAYNLVFTDGKWQPTPGYQESSFNICISPATALGGYFGGDAAKSIAAIKSGVVQVKFQTISESGDLMPSSAELINSTLERAIQQFTPQELKTYKKDLATYQAGGKPEQAIALVQAVQQESVKQTMSNVPDVLVDKLNQGLITPLDVPDESKNSIVRLATGYMTKDDYKRIYDVVEIGGGGMVSRDSYNDIGLKDKVAQQILLDKGILAFSGYVQNQEFNDKIRQMETNSIMLKLDNPKYKDPTSGYDIATYLRDNGNVGEDELRIVGFTGEAIRNAKDYNNQPFVKETDIEKTIKQIQLETGGKYGFNVSGNITEFMPSTALVNESAFNGLSEEYPELAQLWNDTIDSHYNQVEFFGKTEAPVSLDKFTIDFMNARGVKPIAASDVIGKITMNEVERGTLKLAIAEYDKLYSKSANYKSTGIALGSSFVFSPLRALQPEGANIDAAEWVTGAAQLALLAAPGVGALAGKAAISSLGKVSSGIVNKAVTNGIMLGSGGWFAYETANNWNEMNPISQGVSVAMTGVIIGSSLLGLGGLLPKGGIGEIKKAPHTTATMGDISKPAPRQTVTESVGILKAELKDVIGSKTVNALDKLPGAIQNKDYATISSVGKTIVKEAAKVEPENSGTVLNKYGEFIRDNPSEVINAGTGGTTSAKASDLFKNIDEQSFVALAKVGKIDPYDDVLLSVKAITENKRPGMLINKLPVGELATAVENAKLNIVEVPSLAKGINQKFIYKDPQALKIYQEFVEKYNIGKYDQPELLDNMQYHIDMGKALGYSDADIAAFITKQADRLGVDAYTLLRDNLKTIKTELPTPIISDWDSVLQQIGGDRPKIVTTEINVGDIVTASKGAKGKEYIVDKYIGLNDDGEKVFSLRNQVDNTVAGVFPESIIKGSKAMPQATAADVVRKSQEIYNATDQALKEIKLEKGKIEPNPDYNYPTEAIGQEPTKIIEVKPKSSVGRFISKNITPAQNLENIAKANSIETTGLSQSEIYEKLLNVQKKYKENVAQGELPVTKEVKPKIAEPISTEKPKSEPVKTTVGDTVFKPKDEPIASTLTDGAVDLLNKIDKGGAIPAFITKGFEKILKDNGISQAKINSLSPNELIMELRKVATQPKPTPSQGLKLDAKIETFGNKSAIEIKGSVIFARELTPDGLSTSRFLLDVDKGVDNVFVNGNKVTGRIEIKYGDVVKVNEKNIAFIPSEGSPAYWESIAQKFDKGSKLGKDLQSKGDVTQNKIIDLGNKLGMPVIFIASAVDLWNKLNTGEKADASVIGLLLSVSPFIGRSKMYQSASDVFTKSASDVFTKGVSTKGMGNIELLPELAPELSRGGRGGIKQRFPKRDFPNPEELGMSKDEYSRFIKERAANPDLTPEKFLGGKQNEQKVNDLIDKTLKEIETDKAKKLTQSQQDKKTVDEAQRIFDETNAAVKKIEQGIKYGETNTKYDLDAAIAKTIEDDSLIRIVAKKPEVAVKAFERASPEVKRFIKTNIGNKIATLLSQGLIVEAQKEAATQLQIQKEITDLITKSNSMVTPVILTSGITETEVQNLLNNYMNEQINTIQLPRVRNALQEVVQPITQSLLDNYPQLRTEPYAQVLTEVQPSVEPTLRTEPKVEPKVEPKIEPRLETKVQPVVKTEPMPKPETKVEPKVQPAPLPMPKPFPEPTLIKTPKIDKPPPKPPPPILLKAGGKEYSLTKKQMESAIAWRQGIVYKMWYTPYGQKDIINTRQPIPGVTYHEGVGSAAKSVIAKYGEIPPHIRRDMGVVDINVFRTKDVHKPRMEFVADTKHNHKTGIIKQSVVKRDTIKKNTVGIKKVSDGLFI